jgi:GNAT superfamily N-acetyltransferase
MKTLPDGFALRPAKNCDGPEVTELVVSVLASYGLSADHRSTDLDLSGIEAHYHQCGGCFDVLVDQRTGKIVGTVGLRPMKHGMVELRKMYLHADYRGRGLGRILLDHALAEARRRRFESVFLETASVLREAIALYQSAGFEPCRAEHLAARCDQAMILKLER